MYEIPDGSSTDSEGNAQMVLDYKDGAFREEGLIFVATIDGTSKGGEIVTVKSFPIAIHAHSKYVCQQYATCVPYEIVKNPSLTTTGVKYDTYYL